MYSKKKLKIQRFREAIECFKRALLSADMHDITICDRLARLYNEIDDQNSAAVYHQKIIDTSLGLCSFLFAFAFILRSGVGTKF